jgi:hypothetical protein
MFVLCCRVPSVGIVSRCLSCVYVMLLLCSRGPVAGLYLECEL